MRFDATTIVGLILVIAFFAFVFVWVRFVLSRLRVWIRESLANYWDVTINERIRFRSTAWEIQGQHTRQQGCIVSIVQAFTEFGCMVLPIFGALAAIVLLMMLLSGS